jgi:hypothetical protein
MKVFQVVSVSIGIVGLGMFAPVGRAQAIGETVSSSSGADSSSAGTTRAPLDLTYRRPTERTKPAELLLRHVWPLCNRRLRNRGSHQYGR